MAHYRPLNTGLCDNYLEKRRANLYLADRYLCCGSKQLSSLATCFKGLFLAVFFWGALRIYDKSIQLSTVRLRPR